MNQPETPAIRTGKALWRTKEADYPVTINGYLGEYAGRHYVSVEGSGTGFPYDEIFFEEAACE